MKERRLTDVIRMADDIEYESILVTGGCGFIGSNFIKLILDRYPSTDVVNLDLLTYAGNKENLRDIEGNPRYHFIKGDICDRDIVSKAMKNCDAVVHFAAESHVDRSIESAGEFITTNVYGTYMMLQSALEMWKKDKILKKFIMISTDEVYGDIGSGPPSKETDPLKPRNPYSASKTGADVLAQSYFETHKLPVVITRSSNNYGPYQYPEKLIPLFVTNLMEDLKVPLYGDGLNIRDWIYVKDNCSAIESVLRKGKLGSAYNIGGGNERSNLEITKKILSIMGYDDSRIEHVEDRKGHDKRYSLDSTKISTELGWRSEFGFDDALEETVKWYQKNERWWKGLKNP